MKVSSQQERVKLWKIDFEDFLSKPTETYDGEILTNLPGRIKYKEVFFTTNKLQSAIKNISNKKPCGLNEILGEVWKLEEFLPLLLFYRTPVCNQDPIHRWIKACFLAFPKKVT